MAWTPAAAILFACLMAPAAPAQAPPPQTQPAGMVWVAGGEFVMGTDEPSPMQNEGPARRVRIDGFWMDATPVTNAQFRAFVEATGYVTVAERPVDWEELRKQVPPGTPRPPEEMLQPGSLVFSPPSHQVDLRDMQNWWTWVPGASWRRPQGPGSDILDKDDYPVVQIAWEDAAAYGKWAGKRLPTEAEWEFAARGGANARPARFGWGDEFRPSGRWMCNTFTGDFPYSNTAEDGFARQSPVRAFPPNALGLYDTAGNVWQWTADLYRADAHAIAKREMNQRGQSCCSNPTGPATSYNPTRPIPDAVERVIKGGSFLCHKSYCESYRPPARRGMPPDTSTEHIGFRCARSATAPATSQPAKHSSPGK